MTRRSGTSRVSGGGGGPKPRQPLEPTRYPSFRERRPVMFWVIVVAVAAMVLSTGAQFLAAFL